jgi:hypothetical protein
MPNPNMPFGLRPVRDRSGRTWNGAANAYAVLATDATALFIGDPVQLAGSSVDGRATVTRGTAAGGAFTLGVVVGFGNDPVALRAGFRAASTATEVLVADDPELLFEIQCDDDTVTLAATDVGLNADLIAGVGNTALRTSSFQLDTSTKATTATLQLKIEGIVNDGTNDIGAVNQRALVSFNLHQRRNTTGI